MYMHIYLAKQATINILFHFVKHNGSLFPQPIFVLYSDDVTCLNSILIYDPDLAAAQIFNIHSAALLRPQISKAKMNFWQTNPGAP